ncbi:MAG: glutathione S-transferase family protein [Pseudomonadota bacterium]
MTRPYRLFGSEMSPYSVKVRSYLRFKGIAHDWIPRRPDNDAEYRRYARLPIVPTVVTPDDEGIQDSTPIIEAIDAAHPSPAIHPEDGVLAFLSALVEEFGDEWGNKLMFHHRWFAEVDQIASAQTLAWLANPRGDAEAVAQLAAMIRQRMSGRGSFVGSSPANAPYITAACLELLDLLETHLAGRRYLFGGRPAFGDFGLAAQLYEASVDPTCGAMIRGRAPAVLDWCHRMLEPRVDGPFETLEALAPTLSPLLAYMARGFLPWTAANARALAAGAAEFTVDLDGHPYVQAPQKYHARSLAALRARYAAARDDRLDAVLEATGCLAGLSAE